MRLSIIHALSLSIPPTNEAFSEHWPELTLTHLLDDSLSSDLVRDKCLTPAMFARFKTLTDYSITNGADAILFSCSAFAPCINAARKGHSIPILRPNEPMFLEALSIGGKIGLIASFPPSIESMRPELHAMAHERGTRITLNAASDSRALSALNAGNGPLHDAVLADLASGMKDCDCVLLAQFSTARARLAVQSAVPCPVLTSPRSAVLYLKQLLT